MKKKSVSEQDQATVKKPFEDLSKEEQQKLKENFLKEFEQNHTKLVDVIEITDDMRGRFQEVLQKLERLLNEVNGRKQLALEKNNFIKTKITKLAATGSVKVNQAEYDQAEESVARYSKVLDDIMNDIKNEAGFFYHSTKLELPNKIRVLNEQPDTFTEVAEGKFKFIRKYMKNIMRDLNVSYSRYCFGFDNQIKRLDYIEAYVKRSSKAK